ncbi:MAG: hypothetical protein KF740_07525 [Ramlibacter sp.]|nr:hypothetical protein [Ramlibacter sp.]
MLGRQWIPGALALCLAALLPAAAQAQSYICRDNTGRSYRSIEPCKPGLVYYGPVPEQPVRRSYVPRVSDAPEYVSLMSPRCSSLHDAIRTAPARGLSSDTQQDLRKEYRQECRDDEREAMQELSRRRKEKRQEADQASAAAKREANWSKSQQEMCGELKRVLKTKRARTDLNEGEQRDLERSTEAYHRRCG